MKKILALLMIIFVSQGIIQAQYVQEFSLDTTAYLSELSSMFRNRLADSEQSLIEDFEETWQHLDHPVRMNIMEISELMRLRSCRPKPQYYMFIKILEKFLREEASFDQFIPWLESYHEFMDNENLLLKQINNLNNTVYYLIDENLIYKSTSLNWQLGEPKFRFVYDDAFHIKIEGIDLIGLSGSDFIMISEVSGYVDPVKQHFYAQKAKAYWERTGLSRFDVYAEMSDFDFQLKKPEYSADSVLFYNKTLLEEPVLGVFTDRITQVARLEDSKYPRFTTYQSSYRLDKIYPGIDYRGAIAMQGPNLVGASAEGNKASLDFFYDDTIRMRFNSDVFIFSEDRISTNKTEVSIYIENDSLYHPFVILNYNINNEQIRLTRSDDYSSQGPYSDSYHKIDLTFDELYWSRNEPLVKMQAMQGTAMGNGLFESYDFFNLDFYESLQGMDYQNPLAELWTYADMFDGDTFSVQAYASYIGVAVYMVRQQLMSLSKLGFVYFDYENDLVTLRPKLYDYIDASLMKRDYDVIRFVSRTNSRTENAILNLHNYDLEINGIPNIFLSDSQNVKLVPSGNTIIMKRNRDFQFDGTIDAGLFKFYGKNFFFEYDNFMINLQNIDSLSISAKTGESDQSGRQKITTLQNKIENVTGELLIDAPFNKSGLSDFPEYPIFTSRENSYVYFDEKSIQEGVYDRNRFYFELFPFSIDSLDNFTRDAMRLEGTFNSAGILPVIDMEMSLRPDNSLGFFMTTEEEGIELFNGRATFYNDIEMSSAGLHGYGSMDYITSTTWSDDFLFHPDSMMTNSRRFLVRKEQTGTTYPYVENTVSKIRFYPRKDVMDIAQMEKQFDIFDEKLEYRGEFALSPKGLAGNGSLGFPDAIFESQVFDFNADQFYADSSGVSLRKAPAAEFTFNTNNVSVDVDLVKREGDFIAREDYTLIEFPANLYETNLNTVSWMMEKDQVKLSQSEYLPNMQVDIGIDSLKTFGPAYVSRHPQQDSLNFTAPVAVFDYNSNIIHAAEVPFLDIGDSYIFTDNKELQVLEEATIKPLKKARVLTNKDLRHHLLYDANLIVDSRNHFKGGASYDYIDEFDNIYTVRFNELEVDTSIQTYGLGKVAPEDTFMLSPYFAYQGQVRLDAQNPHLFFAGGVKPNHDCDIWGKHWMKFESIIMPDSIVIPVSERMQNVDLDNIYAGTLKTRDSTHLYPTFLSGRKDYFDRNLTFSEGYLYYNKINQSYEIADSSKLINMDAVGNYLALQTESCVLYSEGELDLQLDYGKVNIDTYGNAMHQIDNNSFKMRTTIGMDFFIDDAAMELLGSEIDSLPDMKPVDLTTDFYTLAIKNMLGSETEAEKLENEIGLYGQYSEIPDTLNYPVFFNDVPLEWNQETRSYRCNGEVGIGMFGGVQINKKARVYMEFVERGSGDIFDIYIMLDDDNWFYVAYVPGGLQVLSSNREFNKIIADLPKRDRRVKSRGRERAYIYSISTNRRLSLFRDRFLLNEETDQNQ